MYVLTYLVIRNIKLNISLKKNVIAKRLLILSISFLEKKTLFYIWHMLLLFLYIHYHSMKKHTIQQGANALGSSILVFLLLIEITQPGLTSHINVTNSIILRARLLCPVTIHDKFILTDVTVLYTTHFLLLTSTVISFWHQHR